jgi:hypothetical protein
MRPHRPLLLAAVASLALVVPAAADAAVTIDARPGQTISQLIQSGIDFTVANTDGHPITFDAKLTLKYQGKATTITRALRRNDHGGDVTTPVSYSMPHASDAKAKILRKLKKATTFRLVVTWYTDHLEETTITKNVKLKKGL